MRIGVEHEYCLWAESERLDFRHLIHQVAGHLTPLDPGDPRARRLPSGVALTADGWEAELATPPLVVSSLSATHVDSLLRGDRTELARRACPLGVTAITGFSAHLNVSVEDDRVVEVGRRFLEHAALSLAALTEPPSSLGVFVRPRRGRLEFGGEYVEGDRLVAALTFMAAATWALAHRGAPRTRCAIRAVASREKYGWFVPPSELDLRSLQTSWEWVRPAVLELGLDPGAVEAVMATAHPGDTCTFGEPNSDPSSATGPRSRLGDVRAATEWLTWEHVVWQFTDKHGRSCRAVVPADDEDAFLAELDAGGHDEIVRSLTSPTLRHRRLVVHRDLVELGSGVSWWHDVRPGALVPAERSADGSVPRVSRRAAGRAHRHARRGMAR